MSDMSVTSNMPLIQQVNFQDNGIEIVYVEPRDAEQAQKSGILNTHVKFIPGRHIETEVAELVDAINACIDVAAGVERDAPQAFRR